MNLDTNIALGVRPPPIDFNAMNQGNVLAQLAQLKNADNQNALAQYQLSSAKRTDDSQAALMAAAQTPGFKIDFPTAIKYGAPGMAAYKAQEDASTQALTRKKVQGEIDTSTFKLTQDKLKHGWMSMGEASTPQAAIEKLKDGVKKGYFDEPTALKEAQLIMDMTPEQYKQYRIEKIMGLLDAKDQLGAMLPKTVRQDTGSAIISIQDNPRLPDYGKPIAGADITKTKTFADLTAEKQATTSAGQLKVAQGNAATSAGQLTLAQKKFAFEQANPGMTYVEGPDGTGFGYNKNTNTMTPVMNAGGSNAMAPARGANTNALAAPAPAQAVSPAAKPPAAAGGSGPMGVNLPANAAAPAGVNAPGTPFQGKGQSLNESQSNATAFGMRMKESDAILEKLSKQGVLRGANVEATPFIGQSLGKVLPSFMGGTSSAQQQVNQAKENFITAVLRKESGATIQDSEFDREDRKYFPQVNDSDAVIKQKANARKLAIKAIEIQAGPGAKNIQQLQPSSGITNATANDPLGLGVQ